MGAAVESWSWSRLETWEKCPLQFKGKFILKWPTQGSPAMERGNVVHTELAEYLSGTRAALPAAVATPYQQKLYAEMRDADDKIVEQKWGFTPGWEPTGYFSRDPKKPTWLRTIVDYGVLYEDMVVEIIDHKTGKMYGHNADQIELFALSAMCFFKPAVQVLTRLIYVDAGAEQRDSFDAKDKPALIAKWNARVAPMFADKDYIARPGDHCYRCDFAKSKGGQCRFG